MIFVIIRYYCIYNSPSKVNQCFQHAFKTVLLLVGFRNRSSSWSRADSWSHHLKGGSCTSWKWKSSLNERKQILEIHPFSIIFQYHDSWRKGWRVPPFFLNFLSDFLLLDMFPFVYLPTKQPINQWVYLGDLREQQHQGWSRTLQMCRR